MKNFILLILILFVFKMNAQIFECNATSEEGNLSYMQEALLTTPPIDPNKKYVINIFFHIMNDVNGNNNSPNPHVYGVNDVMKAVRALNLVYNQHNIYFKYVGLEVVNVDAYTANPFSYPTSLENPDAFNIYFANSAVCGSGCAYRGSTRSAFNYSIIESSQFDFAVVHEIGHCLSLYHVHEVVGDEECEHVTRDELNPNFNAKTRGDRVADTPAQSYTNSTFFSGCWYIYDASRADCQGTPYQNIGRRNYMSWDPQQSGCEHFTPGQVLKMKQYLENPSVFYPNYRNAYSDVSALYEPYEEILIPGNTIVSSEDVPEAGGARVCRNYIFRRKYQKGFDYYFSNTEPADGISVDNNTLFVYDDRTEHSIKVRINQVDPNVTISSSTISTLLPYSCRIEPYVSGTIYSMEVLGSMNITEKQLSDVQVKDPEKYEALMEQYYNILRKITESGIVKEKIIYKE